MDSGRRRRGDSDPGRARHHLPCLREERHPVRHEDRQLRKRRRGGRAYPARARGREPGHARGDTSLRRPHRHQRDRRDRPLHVRCRGWLELRNPGGAQPVVGAGGPGAGARRKRRTNRRRGLRDRGLCHRGLCRCGRDDERRGDRDRTGARRVPGSDPQGRRQQLRHAADGDPAPDHDPADRRGRDALLRPPPAGRRRHPHRSAGAVERKRPDHPAGAPTAP